MPCLQIDVEFDKEMYINVCYFYKFFSIATNHEAVTIKVAVGPTLHIEMKKNILFLAVSINSETSITFRTVTVKLYLDLKEKCQYKISKSS